MIATEWKWSLSLYIIDTMISLVHVVHMSSIYAVIKNVMRLLLHSLVTLKHVHQCFSRNWLMFINISETWASIGSVAPPCPLTITLGNWNGAEVNWSVSPRASQYVSTQVTSVAKNTKCDIEAWFSLLIGLLWSLCPSDSNIPYNTNKQYRLLLSNILALFWGIWRSSCW